MTFRTDSAESFLDGDLSRDEILDLFNADRDYDTNLYDVCRTSQKIGVLGFAVINKILKKHGFNILNEIGPGDLRTTYLEMRRDPLIKESYQKLYGNLITGEEFYFAIAPSMIYSARDKMEFMDFLPEPLRSDRDFHLKLLGLRGSFLEVESEENRDDAEMVLAAVRQDGRSLEFASKRCRASKEIVEAAVSNDGTALEFASASLQADREIVLKAVSHSGHALAYAASHLRSDQEIARTAIENNPMALEFVARRPQDGQFYEDLVHIAVEKNPAVLQYVTPDTLQDMDFLLPHLEKNPYLYSSLPTVIKNKKEVYETILALQPSLIDQAPLKARKNAKSWEDVIGQSPIDFSKLPRSITIDSETALAHFTVFPHDLAKAPPCYRTNRAFILDLIRQQDQNYGTKFIIENMDKSLTHDREIMQEAVRRDGYAMEFAAPSLKQDFSFCAFAVSHQALAMRGVDPSFQTDLNFIITTLALGGKRDMMTFSNADLKQPSLFVRHEKKRQINAADFITNLSFAMIYTLGYDGSFKDKSPTTILAELIMANVHLLKYVDDASDPKLWALIQDKARQQNLTLPEGMLAGPSAFKSGLAKLTHFPNRFYSLKTIAACFEGNEPPSDKDARPIVLMLYPKSDHNRAFESYPLIDEMARSEKFKVVYREVCSESEWIEALRDVSQNGEVAIDSLVIAGHGVVDGIQLGNGITEFDETKFIDVSDFNDDFKSEARRYLSHTRQILNYSCSNGLGGEDQAISMANYMAGLVLPESRVISSQIPSNIQSFFIDANLNFSARWYGEKDYIVQGRYVSQPPTP